MMDLDQAWDWYEATRRQLQLFGRLGRKHWASLPWDGPLGDDERLRDLQPSGIVEDSQACLEHLDDFAVLILFSVFESIVREHVLSELISEKARLSHALVLQILEDAVDQIEHGSFHRVLEPFKKDVADLVEEVNQVRRYRNWVAHGRRALRPAAVDPGTAIARLRRFIDAIERGSTDVVPG